MEMKERASDFESDLRTSPKVVIGALAVAGWLLAVMAYFCPWTSQRAEVTGLALLLLGLSAIAWFLGGGSSLVGRWFTVVALTVMVLLAHVWLRLPGSLAWMAIPTGLSAALLGLSAAGVTALGQTVLLLLLPTFAGKLSFWGPSNAVDAGWDAIGVALGAVWGALGVIVVMVHPMYRVAREASAYYQSTRSLLEEARDRRAEAEQALQDFANANRQLGLANERVATLRQIAEEARKAKMMFVAKVSHEFRTPLNMIIGLVALMVETPEIYDVAIPPEMKQDLEVVYRNCRYLANMVNDVLSLTQMEAGHVALHQERIDLGEIVESTAKSVHPLVQKKRLFLRAEIPDDLPEIYCDRTRIQQVVLNLVSNAVRFTEHGGITIRARQRDRHVVVSVADTGPGISPKDVERIFEPFCQGSLDFWRDKEGSGLGLSISKQFVQLHGGRMWLESELGVGTTLFFELPISAPVEHVARPGHQIREDWVWREHAFRTERAGTAGLLAKPRLLVCDETGVLSSLMAAYADQIEFVEAHDLAQATRALEQCPAHIVMLNAASLDALCPLVERARAAMPDTPIVGCSVPRQIETAVEAGAHGYLVKPVTRDDLQRAIEAVGRPVRRVLIVDDDPDVLRLFTRMLRVCDETLSITTASSGDQALNAICADPPDLILLDVVMPGMDGWQVLKHLCQGRETAEPPVVLISARDLVDRPPASDLLVAAMGSGLSVSRLVRCSQVLSEALLAPEGKLSPTPA